MFVPLVHVRVNGVQERLDAVDHVAPLNLPLGAVVSPHGDDAAGGHVAGADLDADGDALKRVMITFPNVTAPYCV